VPWLESLDDQRRLFPGNATFASQAEQRAFVLSWLATSGGLPLAAKKLRVAFYRAAYVPELGSIFSLGPVLAALPATDLCILEEVR